MDTGVFADVEFKSADRKASLDNEA